MARIVQIETCEGCPYMTCYADGYPVCTQDPETERQIEWTEYDSSIPTWCNLPEGTTTELVETVMVLVNELEHFLDDWGIPFDEYEPLVEARAILAKIKEKDDLESNTTR